MDEAGHRLLLEAFDQERNPTRLKRGYPHQIRHRFDDRGLNLESTYEDESGKVALALGGAASERDTYDSLGAVVETSYFGTQGEPVTATVMGIHGLVRVRDDHHRLTRIDAIDVDGGLAVKTHFSFDGVNWPIGAARLVVLHNGGKLQNRFSNAQGVVLATVDCSESTLCAE